LANPDKIPKRAYPSTPSFKNGKGPRVENALEKRENFLKFGHPCFFLVIIIILPFSNKFSLFKDVPTTVLLFYEEEAASRQQN